ncbi:MAG: hypothetical protein V4585_18190 [Bacteroidota bacterium]
MKKFTLYMMTAISLLSFMPISSKAGTDKTPISTEEPLKKESTEATAFMARLEEIKATDKSNMSRAEKKELRKEVRSIKKSMTELGGGVYLSVGAIIIIILLLILLL